MPPHGGPKLLGLGVEEVDVASFVANRKDVATWRVAQAEDTVVNLQGSLYLGRCNVNDLHGAVAASSGDGVTTSVEMDAVDAATDVQGR